MSLPDPADVPPPPNPLDLGAFSVSLTVKDLAASITFYELLGFGCTMEPSENWVIMRNGSTTIGLFQGMFDKNILTFNPGLRQDMTQDPDFTDVRVAQARLRDAGVGILVEAEGESGPAHCVVEDPDGNQVMIDQFF